MVCAHVREYNLGARNHGALRIEHVAIDPYGIAKAALRGEKGELRKLALARLPSLQKLPWTIRMCFLTPDAQYEAINEGTSIWTWQTPEPSGIAASNSYDVEQSLASLISDSPPATSTYLWSH